MMKDELLQEYTRVRAALERAAGPIEAELREQLAGAGVLVHGITSRVKAPESLRYKLSRPEKTYHSLWEVTDLLGFRITTYFEDTTEEIARGIESRLRVDFARSTDKRAHTAGEKFGYRSLHYVCHFGPDAAGLPSEARFEIQIRTVLQHAWAEIEHDLGYKARESIPPAIRRRFSRLSSLLEIADQEFVGIRQELESYQAALERALCEGGGPSESFPLDGVSVQALLRSPGVCAIDEEIAAALGRDLGEEMFFPDYLVKMLRLSGLTRTESAVQELLSRRDRVIALALPYFEFARASWKLSPDRLPRLPRGYSLFFLSHLLVLESPILTVNKVGRLAQFYQELDYPHDEREAFEVASGLVEALRQAGHAAVEE